MAAAYDPMPSMDWLKRVEDQIKKIAVPDSTVKMLTDMQASVDRLEQSTTRELLDRLAASDAVLQKSAIQWRPQLARPELPSILRQLDVDRIQTASLARLDIDASLQRTLSNLHFRPAYEETIKRLASASTLSSALGEVDVDVTFHEMIKEVELSPSDATTAAHVAKGVVEQLVAGDVVESLDDIADRVDSLTPMTLPPALRLYVVGYVTTLVLALCAALYFSYPEAANLVLDASTPVTWTVAIGSALNRRLSPSPQEPDDKTGVAATK